VGLLASQPRIERVQDWDGVLLSGVAQGVAFQFHLVKLRFQCVQPRDVRDRFVRSPDIRFFGSARAVQFIRHNAKEWNLDPTRIAATGGSAGAGISQWLGFHEDLTDPDNDDPILRQSTRLTCMAVYNGQTSYDPRFIRDLFPDTTTYKESALAQLFGVDLNKLDDLPQEKYRLFEEVSALPHLTKDDAPAALFYASKLDTPITSQGIGIHHPKFGKALKEKMDAMNIECEVHTGIPRNDEWTKLTVDFVKKHLRVE
jgi:acetyl esterase